MGRSVRGLVLLASAFLAMPAQAQTLPCSADLDSNGEVDAGDIGSLLIRFGPCSATPPCEGDLDASGEIDAADIASLLISFGACAGPGWATVLDWAPNPAVVHDSNLRSDIAATHLPWLVQDTGTGIEMVLIPSGTFTMGCSASNGYGCNGDESPTHQVTLTQAFYMSRTEVTQAQWAAKMGSNPSYFKNASSVVPSSEVPNRPVEKVSWNDIQPFCTATGTRLPTEAEWEYAYRAGTTTAFHGMPGYLNGTNDDNQVGTISWIASNIGNQTLPVGGKAANGFGLFDMAGNAWEWCQDWYGTYASGEQTNPAGPESGSYRVMRGGSWLDNSNFCRASDRNGNTPDSRYGNVGFRVARTP